MSICVREKSSVRLMSLFPKGQKQQIIPKIKKIKDQHKYSIYTHAENTKIDKKTENESI